MKREPSLDESCLDLLSDNNKETDFLTGCSATYRSLSLPGSFEGVREEEEDDEDHDFDLSCVKQEFDGSDVNFQCLMSHSPSSASSSPFSSMDDGNKIQRLFDTDTKE